MRNFFSIAVMSLIFTCSMVADVVAQEVSMQIPFAQITHVPCAADGAGEDVLLQGTLHVVIYITFDENGGVHGKFHFQPMGATGTGLTTGDIYRATGITQEIFNINAGGLPAEDTFVNSFKIIGPGTDNNLIVRAAVHLTIDANGNLTVLVVNVSTECL